VEDEVKAGVPSEPFLFGSFEKRGVHLAHDAGEPVTFRFEIDRNGDGDWTQMEEIEVPSAGYSFWEVPSSDLAEWVRVLVSLDCQATVWFEYRNRDGRPTSPDPRFEGLARASIDGRVRGALLRAAEENVGLQLLACEVAGSASRELGYYELDPEMKLRRVASSEQEDWMRDNLAIPRNVLELDGNSVLYIDDNGNRFRLPIGNPLFFQRPELLKMQRPDREVSTERDLFQCAGTFFELPARNAGGFAKIRPIATHSLFIHDYCSWRGLLVLTGMPAASSTPNPHILRSDDGNCAVWLGALDDLWHLGKAVGTGGPWKDTPVDARKPSDQYLMTGYDSKELKLSQRSDKTIDIEIQVDISGTGCWKSYQTVQVPANRVITYHFPDAFSAYWIRFLSSSDCIATAQLHYD
jgi:hypothetical protein